LLNGKLKNSAREEIQAEVVQRFNGTQLGEWHNTRPALADKPVLEWNNADIEDALKPYEAKFAVVEPGAWQRVREFALR